MIVLDLFCGQGGAGAGYYLAGFRVVGVDIVPQPRYPFEFVQADAIEFLYTHGHKFDPIHASPPCQGYSVTKSLSKKTHPMLIEKVRKALRETGKPYIIENVPGAPLFNPLLLCGTMFGLKVIRHRLFETYPTIWFPPAPCAHNGRATSSMSRPNGGNSRLSDGYNYVTVVGHTFIKQDAEEAMEIFWMTNQGLSQAIPPVYTRWLGKQMYLTLGGTKKTIA